MTTSADEPTTGLHEHRRLPQRHHLHRRHKSILEYAVYPIEQLAEKSTYLETSWLLLNGELPTRDELEAWKHHHVTTPSSTRISKASRLLPLQRPPHGMLIAMISALGTF